MEKKDCSSNDQKDAVFHVDEQDKSSSVMDHQLSILQCYEMAGVEDNAKLLSELVSAPNRKLVTDSDENGLTSLMHAVVHGNLIALKNLVDLGWSVNHQDANGKTPLAIACYQGWYDGTTYLLANGSDPTIADSKRRLPIHAATHDKKIRCLALLVQHLQPNHLNIPDHELMTALHWATYHDRPDHVQLLISKSANMFAMDCDGKTPLHWAAQQGNVRCAEILIREARGTNLVNVQDNSGKGAIHYAAAAGHYQTIECISKSKACNIHLNDPQDRQPLHWAATMGRATCADLLLRLGADPNMHDVDTRNALYYAKKGSHTECVTILMAAMKVLHMAKREKLKALEQLRSSSSRLKETSLVHWQGNTREDDSAAELRITGSSHNYISSSSIGSPPLPTPNNSKHKLPPIRGSLAKNKVQTIDSDDGKTPNPIEFNATPNIERISTKTQAMGDEKPVNTAMRFVPTTRLYDREEDSD